jgi:aspartate/methionine/tyrosine aminotransferase
MKINKSGAKFSSIVSIGEKIKKIEKETGEEYLYLNRGVTDVCQMDLTNIVSKIDFNSKEIQHYPPNLGINSLRENISKEYFPNIIDVEKNISIINGGMPSLDLCIQILDTKKIWFPKFYWGSYQKMAQIRKKSYDFYESLSNFNLSLLSEDDCIFICSPSNPTGLLIENDYLLEMIKKITDTGAIIIFDSPYYKLFYNDNFFERALQTGGDNIILCESFSKCYGLSGIRLGFICSLHKEFNEELNIRMLYEFNGISTIPQLLINNLISTDEGKKIINNFQSETKKHIFENINYLKENNLLADEIYNGEIPVGIFAIINKTELELLNKKIGSIGLDKFVYYEKDTWSSYSRICVSVQHELFKQFMSTVV